MWREIDIAPHFLIPLLLSASLFIYLVLKTRKRFKQDWASDAIGALTVFLFFYSFFMCLVLWQDLGYQLNLLSFDLNGDGVFSAEEQTPEQEEAAFYVHADTGRNFTPVTTLIPCSVIGFIAFIVFRCYAYFLEFLKSRKLFG